MIRTGQKYTVETFPELKRRMEIDAKELFQTLPDDDQRRIISEFNELAESDGDEQVAKIEELPSWVYDDWQRWLRWKPDTDIIKDYLEHSDGEYIYLYDGCSVHRIVALDPLKEDN